MPMYKVRLSTDRLKDAVQIKSYRGTRAATKFLQEKYAVLPRPMDVTVIVEKEGTGQIKTYVFAGKTAVVWAVKTKSSGGPDALTSNSVGMTADDLI